MIQTKYLIMIGAIICLLIIYYLYSEIIKVKKIFMPAYQKTMALEARIANIERKNLEMSTKKIMPYNKIESPALSITYQSDMVKNGNLSVKYSDLSDTEAKELLKKIESNKNQKQQQNYQFSSNNIAQTSTVNSINNDIFENINTENNNIPNIKVDDKFNFQDDESTTINVKISDLLKNNNNNNNNNQSNLIECNTFSDYQNIYNNLASDNIEKQTYDDFSDGELDADIIKSISESIPYADLTSDNELSDIPVIDNKTKISNKNNVKNKNKNNKLMNKIKNNRP